MHSACSSYLGQYAAAHSTLEALLARASTEEPQVRAAIWNNMAFAMLMEDPDAGAGSMSLQQADKLSAASFEMYPCVLAYRSTRSLVLAAIGRCEEALRLLDYIHYATASTRDRSNQEASRAFALLKSGRSSEARASAERAASLDQTTTRTFLPTLGISTA
jgi:hypothetical protein